MLTADQAPQESVDMASALGKVGANTVLLSLRNLYKAEIIEPLDRAPLLLR